MESAGGVRQDCRAFEATDGDFRTLNRLLCVAVNDYAVERPSDPNVEWCTG